MPTFFDSLGMNFLKDNTDTVMKMVAKAVHDGNAITGYYGLPYINYHYGDLQMIARTKKNEDGELEVIGFDTHCTGNAVWDMRIMDDLTDRDEDPLSRKLLLKGENGSGPFIVNIVNADVLPGFRKDEPVRLQMIAFTDKIEFYENEEEYMKTVEPGTNGTKISIGENSVFPVGIFHDTDDPSVKDLVAIRGTVKGLRLGDLKIDPEAEEQVNPFMYCKVETQFGDLEIIQPMESVEKDMVPVMKNGSIALCTAYLCGDAGIFELDEGIIRDPEHNLRLVAYTLEDGAPERLRLALADHFVYYSETSDKTFENADELIDFFRDVHREGDTRHAHYATISEYADGETPEYPVGTRCIALSYEGSEGYTNIVFVDTDEEGKISRILLSRDSKYRFRIDEETPDVLIDPEDMSRMEIRERLLGRARLLHLFSPGTDIDDVMICLEEHRDEINSITGPLLEEADPDEKTVGKAFASGVRMSKVGRCSEEDLKGISASLYTDVRHHEKESDDPRKAWQDTLPFITAIGILYQGRADEHE